MNPNEPNRGLAYAYFAGRDAALRDKAIEKARRCETAEDRKWWTRHARQYNHMSIVMLRCARAFTGSAS